MTTLGILGTGNMAEAIFSGLIQKKIFKPSQIHGYDIHTNHLKKLARRYKIIPTSNVSDLIKQSNIILLSVKPQHMESLLESFKNQNLKGKLFLSIAAGLDTHYFEKKLGSKIRLIRLMPNTPVFLGLGATAYFANRNCTSADIRLAQKMFESVGIVKKVTKENLLDTVTALSGSGPAFVYLFIDSLMKAAVKQGLKKQDAFELAIQTTKGAAAMLETSKEDVASLIQKVASKGGTTEAGLKILHQSKFPQIVRNCIQGATKRAKELRR